MPKFKKDPKEKKTEDQLQSSQQPEASQPPKASEASTEDLEQKVAELKDHLLRALAEAENTRKRAQKEKEETAKYAIANFARDLVSVVDNLSRALETIRGDDQSLSPEMKALKEGILMTEKELLHALEKHGVKRVEPLGERFDHNLHQAMFEGESEDHGEGHIMHVMQVGYTLHDRLLRPALVGVSKGKSQKNSS